VAQHRNGESRIHRLMRSGEAGRGRSSFPHSSR
jgi:hypothetical protein